MTGISLDPSATTDEPAQRAVFRAASVRPVRGSWTPGLVGALVWGAAIAYVLLQSALGPLFGNRAPARADVADAIIFLVMWAVATPAILRSASLLPLVHPHLARRLLAHLALATAFVLAINLAGPFLLRISLGMPVDPGEALRAGLRTFARLFHLALIVYAFILGVGHFLLALASRRAEAERAAGLSADLAEARLALQSTARPEVSESPLDLARQLAAPSGDVAGPRRGVDPTTTPGPAAPLAIKEDGRLLLVEQGTIDWIEADDDHVIVHAGPTTWRARERLRDVEGRLDPSLFVRIHRSTIVQMSRIRELEPWFRGDYVVVLQSGAKLRLSRNHRERLGSVLGRRL